MKRIQKMLLTRDQEKLRVNDQSGHAFELKYGDLLVGQLNYRDAQWFFEYSELFKSADNMKPIANFPDLHKQYTSKVLWPFFASRIPSLSRKRVLRQVEIKGIDKNDTIGLLKFFGTKTLSNPYTLIPKR